MTSTDPAKVPMLGKTTDPTEPQVGRVRRASGLTRMQAYIGNNPYNVQPTIITSVTTLASNPGIDVLRRQLGARFIEMPRFRSKLVIKPKAHWEEVEYDPGYHFEVFGVDRKVSQKELENLVARTKDRPLSAGKPLWRVIHIPEMEDGTSKVVTMIDHAIGDGISLVSALMFKLIDEGPTLAKTADNALIKTGGNKKLDLPFLTKASRVKELAKKIGKNVTVNDVIMAIATKMLGMYFRDVKKEQIETIKKRKMRTQFVVDTRSRKNKGLATKFQDPNNDVAAVAFQFPLSKFEASEDLIMEVKRKIDFIKCSPQPVIKSKAADRFLPFMSNKMFIDTTINAFNVATALLSNVPGPQSEVHLAGSLVLNIEFYLFSAAGMYMGFFSYNGAISTTVSLDESIGADPHDLAALWPKAFVELYRSIMGKGPEPFLERIPVAKEIQSDKKD